MALLKVCNFVIIKLNLLIFFDKLVRCQFVRGQTMINENGGSPNWFLTSKTLSIHKGASIYTFGSTKKRF